MGKQKRKVKRRRKIIEHEATWFYKLMQEPPAPYQRDEIYMELVKAMIEEERRSPC